MAAQIEVFKYQDEFVDRQVTPNTMHITAVYLALDPVTGLGQEAQCPMTFALSLTRAQRATAIRSAVRDHIASQIGRPDLQPADNNSVFIPISQ